MNWFKRPETIASPLHDQELVLGHQNIMHENYWTHLGLDKLLWFTFKSNEPEIERQIILDRFCK